MPVFELVVVLLLILLNGVFAASEMALVSSRRARLQQMAEADDKGARLARRQAEDPGRFLSTVQIGITLIGILAGAYGGATIAGSFGKWLNGFPWIAPNGDAIAIGSVVVLITYLSLILGELVPKRIALGNAEAIAARVARPMQILSRIASPAVWLLGISTEGVLRVLGMRAENAESVTEEEVRSMIAEGTRRGVFVPAERQMIEGVLRLADRSVRSIMTPRPSVVWLDTADSADEVRREIKESGHTRFLVCRGSIDDVVGTVHTRDLLDRELQGEPFDLEAAAHKRPLVVHENTSILRLLEFFRQSTRHLAVVVDEYGSVEGLVTATDVLEAIAGDLPELGQEAEASAERRADGSWLIDGMMTLDDVELETGFRNLRGEGDYQTLAGFLLWRFGHIPKVGETIVWEDARFEVVDMDGRRIDKVLVVPPPARPEDAWNDPEV